MNVFFALFATFYATYASPVLNGAEQAWQLFKLRHSKTYDTALEESTRKQIFMGNLERISEHNKDYHNGLETFKMDVNHLSDMLPHEVHAPLLTVLGHRNVRELRSTSASDDPAGNLTLPKSVDWRSEGAVTPVKNQQKCASCYAFATTGALEGQIFRKTGILESLSEQNLVDCTYRLGTTGGCEGGNVPSALKYAMVFGVDTEEAYPYKASTGRCRRNVTAVYPRTKIVEYQQVQPASEYALMAAVATIGPVATCFQISPKFDSYKEGIFYQEDCDDYIDTGHCALVVGYGTSEDGQDYWLVKNSMGAEHYGEKGYIRMARNKNNMCGIASFAYYPII